MCHRPAHGLVPAQARRSTVRAQLAAVRVHGGSPQAIQQGIGRLPAIRARERRSRPTGPGRTAAPGEVVVEGDQHPSLITANANRRLVGRRRSCLGRRPSRRRAPAARSSSAPRRPRFIVELNFTPRGLAGRDECARGRFRPVGVAAGCRHRRAGIPPGSRGPSSPTQQVEDQRHQIRVPRMQVSEQTFGLMLIPARRGFMAGQLGARREGPRALCLGEINDPFPACRQCRRHPRPHRGVPHAHAERPRFPPPISSSEIGGNSNCRAWPATRRAAQQRPPDFARGENSTNASTSASRLAARPGASATESAESLPYLPFTIRAMNARRPSRLRDPAAGRNGAGGWNG